jgi:hypothetical protein
VTAVLHPELERLRGQYTQVLDDYDAGHLSYDDALVAIGAMSVPDGDGYVWRINPDTGGFMRGRPGDHAVDMDPTAFVSAQIPSSGPAPWSSQQDLLRPPARPQGGPGPSHGDFDEPRRGPQDRDRDQQRAAKEPRQPRQRGQKGPGLSSVVSADSPAAAFFARNKRFVVVGLACAAALVAVTMLRSSPSDTPAVPVAPPATVDPILVPPVTPVDPSVAPPPEVTDVSVEPVAPEVPLPTQAEMDEVLRAVSAGDRAVVADRFTPEETGAQLAFFTAQYYGYASTGLSLVSTPAAQQDGTAVAIISLVDVASSGELARVKVTWVRGDDGLWRLGQHLRFVVD